MEVSKTLGSHEFRYNGNSFCIYFMRPSPTISIIDLTLGYPSVLLVSRDTHSHPHTYALLSVLCLLLSNNCKGLEI